MTKESVTKVENMEWRDGHYTGEVADGVPHGQGTYIGRDHSKLVGNMKYVGELKNGAFTGQGVKNNWDGTTYAGEFLDEDFLEGTVTWHWGDIYTGKFEGEDLVEGSIIFSNGSRSEGSFKHGDLWDGTWRSSDGTAVRNFSEGIDQDGVNAATSLASSYIHDGLPFDHSVDSAIDWYFEMEPEMEPLQNRYVVDEIEKRIRQSLDDEYSSIAWAAIVAYIKENHVIVTRKGLLFNKYRIEMTESVKKDIEDLIHENAINFRLDADELREAVMNEVNKINEQGQ